uniref:Uncharacterized protein n=1 Tax=Oryza sativa subsp. japonica TaxID=39947 RepID=Q69KP1_ORYSJ|nr:hypothetical protein [Oryza sativa Japonica Group]
METRTFIQVQAPELSVDNMVVFLLESVPGEIRDSAFVSPDSIRRHRRVLAVFIPEVDIRRRVLAYVGFYVVASMSIVLGVDPLCVLIVVVVFPYSELLLYPISEGCFRIGHGSDKALSALGVPSRSSLRFLRGLINTA